jgi:hypothetical protein
MQPVAPVAPVEPAARPPLGNSMGEIAGRLLGRTVRSPLDAVTYPIRASERASLRTMAEEDPDRLKSEARIAREAVKRMANVRRNSPKSRNVPWDQLARSIKNDLVFELTDVYDRLYTNGAITTESRKRLKDATKTAMQHVQDLSTTGEDYDGIPTSLDRVLADETMPAEVRPYVERLLWDLNAASYGMMKKNVTSPFESLLTKGPIGLGGRAASGALGAVVGGMAGVPWMGAAAGAMAPGLLRRGGRGLDKLAGFVDPQIIRNLEYAERQINKGGGTSTTIEDLRGLQGMPALQTRGLEGLGRRVGNRQQQLEDERNEAALKRAARVGRRTAAGRPVLGGAQATIQDALRDRGVNISQA